MTPTTRTLFALLLLSALSLLLPLPAAAGGPAPQYSTPSDLTTKANTDGSNLSLALFKAALGLSASGTAVIPTRENLILAVATTTITFTTAIINSPSYFVIYINGLLQTGHTITSSSTVTLGAEVSTGSQIVGIRFD